MNLELGSRRARGIVRMVLLLTGVVALLELGTSRVETFSHLEISPDVTGSSKAVNSPVVTQYTFLPFVAKDLSAPVLNVISNPGGSNAYSVSWGAVKGYPSYTLQESVNDATFAGPINVYTGGGTGWAASGKTATTFYYRVNASRAGSTSPWSNIQATTVSAAGPVGIYGHVTINGSPASGVSLVLQFYNGSTWSVASTAITAADGTYCFTSAPSLSSGQAYYVQYDNTNTYYPGTLYFWYTQGLTSYTVGTSVNIGDFDIGDVSLMSPPNYSNVPLPVIFLWTRRSAVPTDSYEFYLSSYGIAHFQSAKLGYVGSYTLSGLPFGFSLGSIDVWYMRVYSPDGGFGESSHHWYLIFH